MDLRTPRGGFYIPGMRGPLTRHGADADRQFCHLLFRV